MKYLILLLLASAAVAQTTLPMFYGTTTQMNNALNLGAPYNTTGTLYFNTDSSVVYYENGSGWAKTSVTSGILANGGTNAQIIVDSAGVLMKWVSVSGDATITNTGAVTLATVNSNVGTFGDGTHTAQVTVNAKGLITAASAIGITTGLNPMTPISGNYYYFPFPTWSSTGLAASANFYYAIPFVPPFGMTAKGIAVYVLSTTGDTLRLGIYADNGSNYPGALLFDGGKGGYASGATGLKTLAVSPTQTLTANTLYWLVFICKNGTTLYQLASGTSSVVQIPFLGIASSGGNANAVYTNYNKAQTWSGISALPNPFPAGASLGVTSMVIELQQN